MSDTVEAPAITRPIPLKDAAGILGVSPRWLQDFLKTVPPCYMLCGHKKMFAQSDLNYLRFAIKEAAERARIPSADANRSALKKVAPQQREWMHSVKPVRKHPTGHHESVVYFIKCGRYVKIGFTVRLSHRLAALEAHAPGEMRVCLLLEGGAKLEAQLHKEFDRFRHRGEWFRLTAAIRGFIILNGGSVA